MGFQGFVLSVRLFGTDVVISMPLQDELIPLAQLTAIPPSATSDHEYHCPMIPKVFNLLPEGKFDQATWTRFANSLWDGTPSSRTNLTLFFLLVGGQPPSFRQCHLNQGNPPSKTIGAQRLCSATKSRATAADLAKSTT